MENDKKQAFYIKKERQYNEGESRGDNSLKETERRKNNERSRKQ
jgi:hypothetical protein